MSLKPGNPHACMRDRFWVDEVLWSQGRAAVQLIEQVRAAAVI